MNLYKKLYEGEEICFDLLAGGKPSFEIGDGFTVQTRREFFRRIQSSLPFGEDDPRNFSNGFISTNMSDTNNIEVEVAERSDTEEKKEEVVPVHDSDQPSPKEGTAPEQEQKEEQDQSSEEETDTEEEDDQSSLSQTVETGTREDDDDADIKQSQNIKTRRALKYMKKEGLDQSKRTILFNLIRSSVQSEMRLGGQEFEDAVEDYLEEHLPASVHIHSQFKVDNHPIDFVLSTEQDPTKVVPNKSVAVSCKRTLSGGRWRDEGIIASRFQFYFVCCSTKQNPSKNKIYVPKYETFEKGVPNPEKAIWICDPDESHHHEILRMHAQNGFVANNEMAIVEIMAQLEVDFILSLCYFLIRLREPPLS